MNKIVKVLLACALGAFIGALVALQLSQYFWWVGMLAGGLVGYLTYEIGEIAQAVKVTYRRMEGWRPDMGFWRGLVFMLKYIYILVATLLIGMGAIVYFFAGILKLLDERESSFLGTTAVVGIAAVFFLSLLTLLFGLDYRDAYQKGHFAALREIAHYRRMAREANPVRVYRNVLPFWLAKQFARLITWLRHTVFTRAVLFAVGRWFRFVGLFYWEVFRLIHSDIRLLCGVDAAIGAAFGYFVGNPIIAAIAGGVLGVINYEMVSKRWLKLVPIKE